MFRIQISHQRIARTSAFLAAVFFLTSCAGSGVTKIGSGPNELPKELPKEFQDKFEIKDESALDPPPIPVALPSAVPPPVVATVVEIPAKGKKKGSKKKGEPAQAPVPPPSQAAAPTPLPLPPASGFVYPNRRPSREPIWISEKQVLEITYFGMSAGDFTLDVLPYKVIAGRKVYWIKGNAVSSKVFSLFYRLNDTVESFVDYETIFSHRFHILLDESKQTRDALELNDSEKGQTYYWNRWNHKDRGYTETKEFFPIAPFSQDSLSALYYLRTVPLPDGAVVTFPVVNEGKTWEAVVTVVRREVRDTPLGKVRCVVLKPETKYQGVLQKRGDSFIWLTDDDRRFLVRLEAKVRIGTVVANLKQVELGKPPTQ